MTGPITWEQIAVLIIIGGALVAIWWFLFRNILSVRKELHEFRLEVTRDYASQKLLKEFENRFVGVVKELRQELHNMPERLAAIIKAAKHD